MPAAPDLDDAEKRRLVRDGYDQIADQYLQIVASAAVGHPRAAQTARFLQALPPAADVLELGCGPGVPVARAVLDAGHRYTGVDVSSRQIELARTNVPEGAFLVGDATEVPFEAESFDAVLVLYAITHVPRDDWSMVFSRIHRWLRPVGRLLLNVPTHDDAGWFEDDFLGTGATNWTNGYGPDRTVELLERASFAVTERHVLPDDLPGGPGWAWLSCRRS